MLKKILRPVRIVLILLGAGLILFIVLKRKSICAWLKGEEGDNGSGTEKLSEILAKIPDQLSVIPKCYQTVSKWVGKAVGMGKKIAG